MEMKEWVEHISNGGIGVIPTLSQNYYNEHGYAKSYIPIHLKEMTTSVINMLILYQEYIDNSGSSSEYVLNTDRFIKVFYAGVLISHFKLTYIQNVAYWYFYLGPQKAVEHYRERYHDETSPIFTLTYFQYKNGEVTLLPYKMRPTEILC